ncbi:c-type cytochrome [Ramlibacter sp. AW1]|uniref:C-type cytochrome n=1 Tax=Ramlibacter aurantiacus TaxID=2801330 RepID=A0A936ZQA5_9BURK|nr:c-type cytochrome [Ramlibacter aurantiacus]MBL0421600.1 c-type cytochrome [Ramlibacter aurantiacus]
MSRFREALLAAALGAVAVAAQAQDRFPGIGRAATPAEVKAWDIDVRPDFQGLPKGSGSVAKGMEVWEGKCASCHGVFGESNEVFNPLVGGTTDEDIKTGRVANLKRTDYPGRTTLMKVPTVSTLWDYINRAMPWDAPKSLSTEEVYAVTAYMLNLGGIVPDNFVLSDANIAQVQQRMPNRNGMTTAHALWPGGELKGTTKPDVAATACMSNCKVEAKVTSLLPDHARNAHGNLAEQNRLVGAQRGTETTRPPGAQPARAQAVAQAAPPAAGKMPVELLQKNSCTACHSPDRKLVGPSWNDVAGKHAGKADYLVGRIRGGGSGVWGNIPMPPQSIGAAEAGKIAEWLATGAAP